MKQWQRILVAAVLVLTSVVIYQQKTAVFDLRADLHELAVDNLRAVGESIDLTMALGEVVADLHRNLDLSVLASCGIIMNDWEHGSCVAIRSNLILTAGHCIGINGAWIEIGGYQYKILSQWKSDKYDVGFVTIEGNVPFVELTERTPQLLDGVYLVGSPYGTNFRESITKGIISNCDRNVYGYAGLLQTDAEGAPGSSGCPLFCLYSKIIGICVSGPNPGGGVVLCEPVSHIKEALGDYDAGLGRDKAIGSGDGD